MSSKRKASSEGIEGVQSTEVARKCAPRQDPVSCQTCRTKKLKCDRQQPCSNCKTRRVPCVFGTGGTHFLHLPHSEQTKTLGTTHHRVEARPVVVDNASGRFPHEGQRSLANSEQQMTADWLEKIVLGERIPDALPMNLKDKWMSTDSPRDASTPGQQLIANFNNDTQLIQRSHDPAGHSALAITKLTSFLPRESETFSLFNYYRDYVDYIYHIIIPSRVQAQINHIYQCVHRNSPVDLNHLALLFSILATASYFHLQSSGSPDSSDYAEPRSREFMSMVGAALIQSNYMTYPTIEGLQATVITAHCAPNAHTDSSIRAFFVHATMVSQAKHLSLYCTDYPRNEEDRRLNGFDPVDVETRRRLWWHICGYDWLIGFLSGPQERTYLISPDHMNVKFPANIEDEDISKFHDAHSLPESVPTKMSYAIQRLKLASLCREIVDHTAIEYYQGVDVGYDKILDLDRKLHEAYKDIPDFFRLDPGSRRRYVQLYRDRPSIAWQRLLIQQGFHCRLCRLHREYFIRGSRDPRYSYSHVICLRSARRVLEIKRIMDNDEVTFTPSSSVVWSVMNQVFMAAVILLMDVCFNWDDILADKMREEVLDACRMLDRAQQSSSLVREGISAMMDVLQKHWQSGKPATASSHHQMGPSDSNSISGGSTGDALPDASACSTAFPVRPVPRSKATTVETRPVVPSYPMNETLNADSGNRGLEDIWSEFLNSGATFGTDPNDWTGLLTELTDVTTLCE